MAADDAPTDESRLVEAAGERLHMRVLGAGPDLLMIHGTGSAGHSWRHLAPLLARRWRVLIPDLPGHGRSPEPSDPAGYGPGAMNKTLSAILSALDARPQLIFGHSAGAALGAWLMLEEPADAPALVALAPAMLGFRGARRGLFTALAKAMAVNPLMPGLISWRARDPASVRRLLEGVGSELDADGVEQYAALLRSPRHVRAVLRMMAQWDLDPLRERLPELGDRVLLVTGNRDQAVPEPEIRRLQGWLSRADRIAVPGAGHLLHEERPREVLDAVRGWASGLGIAL